MDHALRGLGRFVLVACLVVGNVLVLVAILWGQAVPPGGPPPCESQLELARQEHIALKKQLAQNMFQAAVLEEQGLAMKKQLAEAEAKGKATEKK